MEFLGPLKVPLGINHVAMNFIRTKLNRKQKENVSRESLIIQSNNVMIQKIPEERIVDRATIMATIQ